MSSLDQLNCSAEKKNYIINKLNPILEDMVTECLSNMPDEPAGFMVEWLKKNKNASSGDSELAAENAALRAEIEALKAKVGQGEAVISQVAGSADPDAEEEEEEEDDDDCGDELPEHMMQSATGRGKARASVSAEAYGQWNQKKEFTPPVHPKTDEQKERLKKTLLRSFLFSNVDEKDMVSVIDAMLEVTPKDGERVINQGDDGDFLFVIEAGELECWKKFPDAEEEKMVKLVQAGDAFGELALLYNVPRAASVQSKGDCILWKLDRDTFNNIVKDAAARKRERYESFLKSVKLLSGIGAYELSQIADALKPTEFKAGDFIMTQGEKGDVFYIMEEGSAEALKDGNKVMDYESGSYFGELALINNAPRAASIKATSDCKVLALERVSFKRLLGSLEEALSNSAAQYA